MFVVFEGPDGCGKSTQAKALVDYATAQGVRSCLFRDPGSTPFAENMRAALMGSGKVAPEAVLFTFLAARADLWATIKPLLNDHLVVCDRWTLSTLVYQGLTGDLPSDFVVKTLETVTSYLNWQPAKTVVLDCSPATLQARRKLGVDRFEAEGERKRIMRANSYQNLGKWRSDCVLVDGNGTHNDVFFRVLAALRLTLRETYPQLYPAVSA